MSFHFFGPRTWRWKRKSLPSDRKLSKWLFVAVLKQRNTFYEALFRFLEAFRGQVLLNIARLVLFKCRHCLGAHFLCEEFLKVILKNEKTGLIEGPQQGLLTEKTKKYIKSSTLLIQINVAYFLSLSLWVSDSFKVLYCLLSNKLLLWWEIKA